MHRQVLARFLFPLLSLAFWAAPAAGAPRDAAAQKKIEEAINQHYLATEFDRAEQVLVGTVNACEDRCSPSVKARAWMYVGVVRGSGRQDISGAQEAFQQALALDPGVRLDEQLATPAVQDAFNAARRALGQPAGPSAIGAVPLDAEDVPGDMECTPSVHEVETRRPIPIACTTDEPASRVLLRYKPFGGDTWASVTMQKRGEYWQGEIPCSDTSVAGTLRWYVQARDAGGDVLDSHGTKKQPVEVSLVQGTEEAPPSYPGQKAPERCAEAGACPPGMEGTPACPGTGQAGRGTKPWGAPCDTSVECDVGLLCIAGEDGPRTCESAPSCDVDSDCPPGTGCMAGVCDISDSGEGPSGPYTKNWVGLHFAPDIAFLPSGTGVCDPDFPSSYECFVSGQRYDGMPRTQAAGNISDGGASVGTMRLMLSFERLVTRNIGVEGRAGLAFNGAPQSFLPVHAEVRGKYWFGQNVHSRSGFRPYVHFGGGMAQVDAALLVRVSECSTTLNESGLPTYNPAHEACQRTDPPADPNDESWWRLNAYRRLGEFFVTTGGGAMYAFGPTHGLVVNLNLMVMLPTTGLVVQPSLGYAIGL